MSNDWAVVDQLILELRAVRAASDASVASALAKEAMSQAIQEAGQAVSRSVQRPEDTQAQGDARQAILVAKQVVRALDAQMARSQQLHWDSEALLQRSAELVARARQIASGG